MKTIYRKTVYRFLLILFFIAAAITCYAIGSQSGMFIFILLGFGFEVLMWLNLFGSKKNKHG